MRRGRYRFPPPLSAFDRQRFLRWVGFLARPRLDEAAQRQLRRVMLTGSWSPLPHLPALALLEPLFLHHAAEAGIPADRLLASPPSDSALAAPLRPPSFEALAAAYYRRRAILVETTDALRRAGVERLMAIKGTAVAPLYPSPALRQMCDLDFVLDARDAPKIAPALRDLGCSRKLHGGVEVWRHPTGLPLDFHLARTRRARAVFARSVPFPDAVGEGVLRVPHPADHLAIVAQHAAREAGGRLWRDVCDLQTLLDTTPAPDDAVALAAEAMGRVEGTPVAVALAALFRFVNRIGGIDGEGEFFLPERPAHTWSRSDEANSRRTVELYRQAATETVPPGVLGLLRHALHPGGDWVRRLAGAVARGVRNRFSRAFTRASAKPTDTRESPGRDGQQGRNGRGDAGAGTVEWRERDPVLGDLPPRGSWARHGLKIRLLLGALTSGRARSLFHLIALQRRVALRGGKPFAPLRAADPRPVASVRKDVARKPPH